MTNRLVIRLGDSTCFLGKVITRLQEYWFCCVDDYSTASNELCLRLFLWSGIGSDNYRIRQTVIFGVGMWIQRNADLLPVFDDRAGKEYSHNCS